jgi:aryl-alcohol dehydrogenase-like predicted oxidoreductase
MKHPEYSLFNREKIEKECTPIFENLGFSTAIWISSKFGILTGKYNDGILDGSRLDAKEGILKVLADSFNSEEVKSKVEKACKFVHMAEKIGYILAQLYIAWCIKNVNISTAIMGAPKVE